MPIPPIVTRTCVKVLRDTLPDVQAIYVFGSVASEQATDESDVDLAVLVPKPVDEEQRWELQGRLAKALGKDVDLIDLRSASAVLRVQVLSTGELLYDANPTLTAEFEAFALADYARLNEERAGILGREGAGLDLWMTSSSTRRLRSSIASNVSPKSTRATTRT